jgi:glutamate synthase domain-containing protein 2
MWMPGPGPTALPAGHTGPYVPVMSARAKLSAAAATAAAAIVTYDLVQRHHAILRNFPLVGHLRYVLEEVGPELRQYIVTSNTEEKPFSRDQRRWIYASAKQQNNYFAFGTSKDLETSPNYLIIKHSPFPLRSPLPGDDDYDVEYRIPAAKVLGRARGRLHAFRPESVVNVSAMSFGALSSHAIAALNQGARLAGCLHNTGEGGISEHHLQGGDLVWQLGSGYFGARDEQGRFDLARLCDVVAQHPVRAIEIKLSQGAKPGLGGVLPAAKVTPEISRIRGVPLGRDCISPAAHPEFHDADSLLDFVERIAEATGLPVGIKSAIGEQDVWRDLAEIMSREDRGVDFITVDGGEGGTGAGPLVFTDQVALPFKVGFSNVYREFAERGITDRVVFIGSGKLGFPHEAVLAFGLGCDMVNVAREAMMAIGCIQAQRCHTGKCPTGVATQHPWLVRGLDPELKSARLANYLLVFRKELLALSRACGVEHPAHISLDHIDMLDDRFGTSSARAVFGYEPTWGVPTAV